jgi:hypothetical protein
MQLAVTRAVGDAEAAWPRMISARPRSGPAGSTPRILADAVAAIARVGRPPCSFGALADLVSRVKYGVWCVISSAISLRQVRSLLSMRTTPHGK